MPASGGDPVSASLSLSLASSGTAKEFDKQLLTSSHQVLNSKIDYELSCSYQASVLGILKEKYIVLDTKDADCNGTHQTLNASVCRNSEMRPEPDAVLPTPKLTLFPAERVQLGWRGSFPVGAGMINVGNTCYLNSTLQALFHVPALVNWLLSDSNHLNKCTVTNGICGECIICAMNKTLKASQSKSGSVIKPFLICNKLKMICKHMVPGQQEDAHEFMRYLMESMEEAYLIRFKGNKLDNYSKETTPLNQIFGGYMRTEVNCLQCRGVSTTFQHFQDLLLDIRRASTLDDALAGYFQRERLDGDDAYRCERCHKKVSATKKFSVEKPPMVLCIQLKRFSVVGGKINKHVSFTQRLDMTRFLCQQSPYRELHPLTYRLMSIVTHMGSSVHCGHYTAVAQTCSGHFYQFDDSAVRPISLNAALDTNAYIIIYELERLDHRVSQNFALNKPSTVTSGAGVVNGNGQKLSCLSHQVGPVMPVNHKAGPSLLPSPNLKVAANHKPTPSPSIIPAVHKPCSGLPPTRERDRVIFGLQPRLLMHIKNGKVYQPAAPTIKSSLVPYESGESSGSDTEQNVKKPDMPILELETNRQTQLSAKQNSSVIRKPELFPNCGSSSKPPFLVKSGDSLSHLHKSVIRFNMPSKISQPAISETSQTQKALKNVSKSIECLTTLQNKTTDSYMSPRNGFTDNLKPTKVDGEPGEGKNNSDAAVEFVGNGTANISNNSLSETLHVNTSSPSVGRGKISTQSWQVTDVSLHSPSVHSESSNTSIASSTTPWSISDMKRVLVKRMPRTFSETMVHTTMWISPEKGTLYKKYSSDTEVGFSIRSLSTSSRANSAERLSALSSCDCTPSIPKIRHGNCRKTVTDPVNFRQIQLNLKLYETRDKRMEMNRENKNTSYCNGDVHTSPSRGNEDNEAYKWVEKTHESLGLVKHNGEMNNDWDANNRSDIASQLVKLSHQGYGSSVNSWTGGRSRVDREVDNERREDRKRSYKCQYDEDFDLGRMKKIKQRNNFEHSRPKYNKFDEYQSENIRWNCNKGPYYQSYPQQKFNFKKNRINHHNSNYHRRKYDHHRNFYGAKQERWRH